MKKAILTLLIFSLSYLLNYAQSPSIVSLFNSSLIGYSGLSTDQKGVYDKLATLPDADTLHIVTLNAMSIAGASGDITIDLPFLPCSNLTFVSRNVNYEDDYNYEWYGELNDWQDIDSVCGNGFLTLVNKSDVATGDYIGLRGSLKFGEFNSSIYYLGDDLYVLVVEIDTDTEIHDCTSVSVDDGMVVMAERDCTNRNVDVLILYDPSIVSEYMSGNIQQQMFLDASFRIFTVNTAFSNSGINRPYLTLVGAMEYIGFTHSNNLGNDFNTMAAPGFAQTNRHNLKADIVVTMTKKYPGAKAAVRKVGCVNPNTNNIDMDYGFAVVAYNKDSDGLIFSHEVGHFFDGRHQNDNGANNPGYAYAYKFSWKKTLIYTGTGAPLNKRIPYYSNPQRYYNATPTGTSVNNNARRISEYYYSVGSFFTHNNNFGNSISFSVVNLPPPGGGFEYPCPKKAVLEVDYWCGTAPYTHTWEYSLNGINWLYLGTGMNQELIAAAAATSTVYVRVTTYSGSNSVTTQVAIPFNCAWAIPMDMGTGNNPQEFSSNFEIFPNPNDGSFALHYRLTNQEQEEVTIYLTDITGRVVEELYKGNMYQGDNKLSMQFKKNLSGGIYLLNIKGRSIIETKKIYIVK